jgi:hypothetical protein
MRKRAYGRFLPRFFTYQLVPFPVFGKFFRKAAAKKPQRLRIFPDLSARVFAALLY